MVSSPSKPEASEAKRLEEVHGRQLSAGQADLSTVGGGVDAAFQWGMTAPEPLPHVHRAGQELLKGLQVLSQQPWS